MPHLPWSHPNLKGKWDASAITGLVNADPVATWSDGTATSDMTQATGTARPTYRTGVRAGKAVVRFDADDYLESSPRLGSVMTMALVLSVSGSGTTVQMWNGSTSSGGGPILISGNRGAYIRSVTIPTDGAYTASTWERWIIVFGSGFTRFYLNGALVIDAANTMNTVASGYARLGASDGAPEFFSGGMDLAEAHLYDAALTPADVASLDDHLADKWGFTGRTTVTATRSTTWSVRTTVTATRSTTWNMRAQVVASRATTWQVRARVTSSRSTTWSVAVVSHRFSPPTHEEPIRSRIQPMPHYRLTYAASIVRVAGHFTSIRTPVPEVLAGLTEGVDFFRGGYDYEVSGATALELAADGYTTTPV